jgi:hypothetical protein
MASITILIPCPGKCGSRVAVECEEERDVDLGGEKGFVEFYTGFSGCFCGKCHTKISPVSEKLHFRFEKNAPDFNPRAVNKP